MRFRAQVRVAPKPSINDPEGDTIASALARLGFEDVDSVRSGKYFDISLNATDTAAAEASVRQMCEKLLANPVIESYELDVVATDVQ